MSIGRRIRAAVVFAGLWAVVWSAAAALMGIMLVAAKGGVPIAWWQVALFFAKVGGGVGALSGAVFSIALMGTAHADSVDALATKRIGLIGGVAGAALPLGILVVTTIFSGGTGIIAAALVAGFGAVVGSGLAVGSLALARQAPPSQRELPGGPAAGRLGSGAGD